MAVNEGTLFQDVEFEVFDRDGNRHTLRGAYYLVDNGYLRLFYDFICICINVVILYLEFQVFEVEMLTKPIDVYVRLG